MDLEILFQAKKSKNGIIPEDVSQQDVFTPSIWELVDKFTALQEKNLLTKNKVHRVSLMDEFVETFMCKALLRYPMRNVSWGTNTCCTTSP